MNDTTFEFIRKVTRDEKRGGVARSRGYRSIPRRAGWQIVYKPYGPDGNGDGAGYYYAQEKRT